MAAPDSYLETDFVRLCGFYATLTLLFFKISTIHEIIRAQTNHSLYLMYIFTPPAILGMVFSGGIQRTLRQRTAWMWLGFVVLVIAGVPFSSWVGGSAKFIYGYVRDQLSLLFLLAGTIFTWKECRKVFHTIALAVIINILYSLAFGAGGGRLALEFDGTIANSNDLAAHLVLLLPLLLYVMLRPGTGTIVRTVSAGFTALGLYTILRTGSRGGLIATALAGAIFLFRATPRQRIVAAVLVPTAIMTVLLMMPQQTFERLMSFSADRGMQEETLESTESRKYLLMKSLEFTLRHPIFGVGMGQFSSYEGLDSKAAGQRGNWHETHNSYTQVSSECGIPALIFYLSALVGTFGLLKKTLQRARTAGNADIATAANCMFVGLAGFCVAIIFLPFAYRFYLPALTGIAIGVYYAAERELNKRRPQPVSSGTIR